ncbi:MAG: PilZ domain-containing protein [Chromatiaceae bacterium]
MNQVEPLSEVSAMTDVDPTQKRQFARLRFHGSVTVAPIPRSLFNTPLTVVAEDLSEQGVRFVSPEPFPVGARLVIDLDLPDRGQPLYTLGRVIWVVRMPDGLAWRVGVTFYSLSTGARARLHGIVVGPQTRQRAS